MQIIKVNLGERSYDIILGQNILSRASDYMNLKRKVLIVTDSGVPREYAEKIAACCSDARIYTFPFGEESKSLSTFEEICAAMLSFGMQRKDAVVAVGGGVVGDITGFAASAYMRGIDFYNVPTTLLSSVDSSIGGKCAVDFCGVKNIIGAFYQPKAVLIDTDTLLTLDKRQFACGCAEIIKEAVTFDSELFSKIEEQGITMDNVEDMIKGSLEIKRLVVEKDEREGGIRKALNFGHTYGHGIEASGELLHGECVALGMIPMAAPPVRKRLKAVLKRAGLPTVYEGNIQDALEFMKHDKKGDGNSVDAILCNRIGEYEIQRLTLEELIAHVKENLN